MNNGYDHHDHQDIYTYNLSDPKRFTIDVPAKSPPYLKFQSKSMYRYIYQVHCTEDLMETQVSPPAEMAIVCTTKALQPLSSPHLCKYISTSPTKFSLKVSRWRWKKLQRYAPQVRWVFCSVLFWLIILCWFDCGSKIWRNHIFHTWQKFLGAPTPCVKL